MKQSYIDRNLANEIRKRHKYLQKIDPSEVRMKCRQRVRNEIEKSSQFHSYRIEHPKEVVPFSIPRNRDKAHIQEGIKNIEAAFLWGITNFDPKKFDDYFIRKLAGKITPEIYSGEVATYRESGARLVTLKGFDIPPDPYKLINIEIPAFISSLREQLECPDIINKVESGVYSHLNLARLHPFRDGNGRAARLLQNVIFDHYCIPIPVIETGERMTYIDLIANAITDIKNSRAEGYEDRITEGERLFYDFIGGKVNASLDKIITSCNGHNH